MQEKQSTNQNTRECRNKIKVLRNFGQHSLDELYADYVAEQICNRKTSALVWGKTNVGEQVRQ